MYCRAVSGGARARKEGVGAVYRFSIEKLWRSSLSLSFYERKHSEINVCLHTRLHRIDVCTPSRMRAFASSAGHVQRLKAGYTLGDLGFDRLGLKPTDQAELRIMQKKELSHDGRRFPSARGRHRHHLVAAGCESFEGLLLGGFFSQEAPAELARDATTSL